MTEHERRPRLAWLGRALPVVLATVSIVLLVPAVEGDASPPCASDSSEANATQILVGAGLVLSLAATLVGIGYFFERVRLRLWLLLFAASLASVFAGGFISLTCLQ